MKDTVITGRMKRNELFILLACFIAAYTLNVVGIIMYKSPAVELVSQLHIVLLIALILYGAAVVFRVVYYLISLLWKRRGVKFEVTKEVNNKENETI